LKLRNGMTFGMRQKKYIHNLFASFINESVNSSQTHFEMAILSF